MIGIVLCLFSCYKYLEFPCFIYEKCIISLGVMSAVGENHRQLNYSLIVCGENHVKIM
jgi:hypothetical protein